MCAAWIWSPSILVAHICCVCCAPQDDIVFAGVAPAEFAEAVTGKTLVAVRRKGKQLWMEFDSAPHATFHFGMSGAFTVKDQAPPSYKRFVSMMAHG